MRNQALALPKTDEKFVKNFLKKITLVALAMTFLVSSQAFAAGDFLSNFEKFKSLDEGENEFESSQKDDCECEDFELQNQNFLTFNLLEFAIKNLALGTEKFKDIYLSSLTPPPNC